MPLLIDKSYFLNTEISIPQVTEVSVAATVTNMIAMREPQFLEELFGYPLYKLWVAEYTAGPVPGPEVISARMKKIRDGAEYVNKYENTVKYPGLKHAVANYVYYWWLRKETSITTGRGEKKDDSQINVDSSHKQVRAWNDMVDINRKWFDFMMYNTDFPELPPYTLSPSYWRSGIDNQLFVKINALNL